MHFKLILARGFEDVVFLPPNIVVFYISMIFIEVPLGSQDCRMFLNCGWG